MPATLQGGSLGRWFEELCRIKHARLLDVVSLKKTQLRPGILPKQGGVYAFWWIGSKNLLMTPPCNRNIALKGPGGDHVIIKINDEWLGLSTGLPIPLYVGKSASKINKRIGQHLMLSKKRILSIAGGILKAKPPTTSCQLRAGIEHLFPKEKDTRSLILKNIGLSYVLIDGADNAANRFYLEDMAIGLMHPPLNVDVER